MSRVAYTTRAQADLLGIITYTLKMWGEDQAAHYLEEMEDCCARLATNPGLGRIWKRNGVSFHRREQGGHVIFCRPHDGGIKVFRILHQRMLPKLHIFAED